MSYLHTTLTALFAFFLISCGTTSKVASNTDYPSEIAEFRKAKKQEFRESDHAPLKGAELDKMRFYKANESFRVTAKVELIPPGESITINTSSGEERNYIEYARLTFELDSQPHTMILHTSKSFAAIPKYKDLLFFMFTDETNGEETYGGGRYIDLSKTDIKDGTIVLDFNKAYHPYCHYSAGYSCPIPPADNHISVPVKAGEKNYAGEYKGAH